MGLKENKRITKGDCKLEVVRNIGILKINPPIGFYDMDVYSESYNILVVMALSAKNCSYM